MVLDEPVGMSR
jgi:hypothetical protein